MPIMVMKRLLKKKVMGKKTESSKLDDLPIVPSETWMQNEAIKRENYCNQVADCILDCIQQLISQSIAGSIDKLSYKDEEEDYIENDEKDEQKSDNKEGEEDNDENDNKIDTDDDLSSSNTLDEDEDDVAIIEILQQQQKLQQQEQTKISVENNSHEIDESDSDEMSEGQIAETIETIKNAQTKNDIQDMSRSDNGQPECFQQTGSVSSASNESPVDLRVSSQTPSGFESDTAFHMDILPKTSHSSASCRSRSRASTRKNLSFSNERLREIERHNHILLQKILTQKPRKGNVVIQNAHTTSSAVNRRKQQRQIDLDNEVLKKKIEAISVRRPQALYR